MSRLSNIIVILFFVALSAHAQLTDWQNISSKNFVMKIIHDQNFLYVGTKGGIVKIDKQSGKQTVLKRADAIPEIILFAPDGTILLRGNRMDAIEQKLAEIFSE